MTYLIEALEIVRRRDPWIRTEENPAAMYEAEEPWSPGVRRVLMKFFERQLEPKRGWTVYWLKDGYTASWKRDGVVDAVRVSADGKDLGVHLEKRGWVKATENAIENLNIYKMTKVN